MIMIKKKLSKNNKMSQNNNNIQNNNLKLMIYN